VLAARIVVLEDAGETLSETVVDLDTRLAALEVIP
jgi:hypothetical protein